ncbi:MAG: hypothetical protein Q9216_001733 [Gyalolechia sp. 2 TL-2023]
MSDESPSATDGVLGIFSFDTPLPEASEGESPPLRPEVSSHHDKQNNEKASVVDYDDEYEQLSSDLQLVFDQHAQVGRQASWLYERVAVLLISWDVACDDLNTKGEVDELARVWREVYRYKVRNIRLKCSGGKLAQVQINKTIADFVYDEDSSSTLLLVYYAGHGTPGPQPGRLELSSKRVPTVDRLDTVVWNLAEAALQQTKADVFEIFDCCYAGDLGRSRAFGTRCFEYLGATSSGATTRCPGPASFTSGLIWALEALAKEHERFTTTLLANKIRQAPDFPKKQVPILQERNNNCSSLRRIVIAPLLEGQEDTKAIPTAVGMTTPPQAWGFIYLSISLDKRPSTTEVAKLAKDVSLMMETTDLKVRNVKWGGLFRYSPMLRKAVRAFLRMKKVERRQSHHYPHAASSSLPSPFRLSSSDEQSTQGDTHISYQGQSQEALRKLDLGAHLELHTLQQAIYHFGTGLHYIENFFSGYFCSKAIPMGKPSRPSVSSPEQSYKHGRIPKGIMAQSAEQASKPPHAPDRSLVITDGGTAMYDNKFDVDERVWQKNPATDHFEWLMTVTAKRYKTSPPSWEYQTKDSDGQMYNEGTWVPEAHLREA